jgi:hypothetical protein
MDIYEVELYRRGRWEHQEAHVVAARDADEAAYRVTGKHLREDAATRPQAWQRKPTAEAVLRRVRQGITSRDN